MYDLKYTYTNYTYGVNNPDIKLRKKIKIVKILPLGANIISLL